MRIEPILLIVLLALSLAPATPPLFAQQSGAEPASSESDADLLSGFEEESVEGDQPASGEEEELTSGFESDPLQDLDEATKEEDQDQVELNGFLRFDSSFNYAHKAPAPGQTDYRGLSKLRMTLRLELETKISTDWEALIVGQAFRDFVYNIQGREQYTQQVLDRHEDEAEFREVYLRGSLLDDLDIKIGRQVVAWGKSDNIRVVDILNPLDFREPGLTDLADLRLPVTMTRIDWYSGKWGLMALAIHEIRFNKDPAPGSDFLPFPSLPPEEVPEDGYENSKNTEYGLSLAGNFSGWDLAFYWAQVFDDTAHFADRDPGPGQQLVQRHARITMGGFGLNVVGGNWLYKLEVARFSGLRFFNIPERDFTRLDGLVGLEYSGFTDTTLSVEAVDQHLFDFEEILKLPPDGQLKDVNQYVLTYRGTFLREKLDLVGVLIYFGARFEKGSLQRYSATYELAEALDLTGGVVIYTAGDGGNFLLANARDNDRVFFDVKWSY